MSANLITLASNYLEPDLLGRIASALGVDTSVVRKASSAAIPALLASFADVSSSANGANRLVNAVNDQNPAVLSTLASALSGSGPAGLVEAGLKNLRSLMGRNSISALSSAVAKFAGFGEASSSSLIGVLTPFLLGVLRKQVFEHGLDASGLARLLASQKENFQSAMPSGFRDLLRSAGFPTMADASPKQQEMLQAWSPPPASRRSPQSSQRSWLLWLLPLIAIGAISWWYFGNQMMGRLDRITAATDRPIDQTTAAIETTQTTPTPEARDVSASGADLTLMINKTLAGVRSTLQGITDEGSARSALPQLEAATLEFEKIAQLSAQLPQEGKSALATLVTAARPALESSFDKVLAIPGVDSVAKPTIDILRGKLTTLSTA